MRGVLRLVLASAVLWGVAPFLTSAASPDAPPHTALVNGRWFNGHSFEPRTVYSVNGQFTFSKPERVDGTIDLSGLWVIPPFGDAHNHSIGTGLVQSDKNAIHRYLVEGVFYAKMQGNIWLTDEIKVRIGVNRFNSVDAVFAQGSITASGGHPIELNDMFVVPRVYLPGFSAERLKDYRNFTVDSEEELDRKWPAILEQKPDFIKAFLLYSDEYEKRKNDPAYMWNRGLSPQILAKIVEKAHAVGLKVSVHVNTAADFHNAVEASVDEVSHVPLVAVSPITREDAQIAAKRGIVVDTTCATVRTLPAFFLPTKDRDQILKTQMVNLKLLREQGVRLAIGTDDPSDSSLREFQYLRGLGVFDDATLLKMWRRIRHEVSSRSGRLELWMKDTRRAF